MEYNKLHDQEFKPDHRQAGEYEEKTGFKEYYKQLILNY